MKKLDELSKEIAYIIRHVPCKYGLEIDQYGWINLEQLLNSLNTMEKWKHITKYDVINMIEISSKKRYEINQDKIRALYGHSIPQKIIKEEKIPPNILYHGTARRFLLSILKNGLLPKDRQYVHLSKDIETAQNVGKRHDSNSYILTINAKKAYKDGIKFYLGSEDIWLADRIPPQYLEY